MRTLVFLAGIMSLGLVVWQYYGTESAHEKIPGEIRIAETDTKAVSQPAASKAEKEIIRSDWFSYRNDRKLAGRVPRLPVSLPVKVWDFQMGTPVKSGPLVNDGIVYATAKKGSNAAIELQSGRKIWQSCFCEPVSGTGLLMVHEDRKLLFIGSEKGTLYCLDAADGKTLFNIKTRNQINGAPTWFLPENASQALLLFGSHDCFLYAVDAVTGETQWKFETDNYVNGTPAMIDSAIFLGGCDGFLRGLNPETGSQTFSLNLGNYIPASPAAYANILYVALHGGMLIAADSKTGQQLWSYKSEFKGDFFASPAVNEQFVVVADSKGRIHVVERSSGQLARQFNLSGDCNSEPLVDDENLMISDSDGNLYVFELKTGRQLWKLLHGSAIEAPVTVLKNAILVGDNSGALTAYQFQEAL